jgi:hypothetical protein
MLDRKASRILEGSLPVRHSLLCVALFSQNWRRRIPAIRFFAEPQVFLDLTIKSTPSGTQRLDEAI